MSVLDTSIDLFNDNDDKRNVYENPLLEEYKDVLNIKLEDMIKV